MSGAEGLEIDDATGRPSAYVRGLVTFLGVELEADAGALVPRRETELLARTAIDVARASGARRIVDMCCGAGNLACAIAVHLPDARVWATDLTDGCVALARRNVARLGLGDRVVVAQGDLFAGLAGLGEVDLVVCNPPYISSGKLAGDRAPLLAHEPREAFDGGPYGLSIHQRVIRDAVAFLAPGATLAFEIGLGQDRQLKTLFERARAYRNFRAVTDDAGNVRGVRAERDPAAQRTEQA